MKLCLDIETLPADESMVPQIKFLYGRKLEKIAKRKETSDTPVYGESDASVDFDKYYRGTSLDGSFGQILCIAYAIDDDEVRVICHPDDEKKTLQEFWGIAKSAHLFIGHNVMDFDLRFIYQRSIVLGVRPSRELSFARYRSEPIYDTMKEWAKWSNNNISLENLAIALDIDSPKDGIDGSQVYDFYKEGKVKEICDYCKRDVAATRAVYKRMIFALPTSTKEPTQQLA
ncbi:MAG: ribonuclease H-like domain-containing protein [Patescibacteria group bacterium]|jgi:hypothetical protein